MYLEVIHLVVCHCFYNVFQHIHGRRLTRYVKAEASHFELRIVFCDSHRDRILIQLRDLKDRTCRPVSACRLLSFHGDHIVCIDDVSLFIQAVLLIFFKNDITCCFAACCNCEFYTELSFVVLSQGCRRCLKRRILIYDLCAVADRDCALFCAAVPLSQLRDHDRFSICSGILILSRNCNCMFYCSLGGFTVFCHFVYKIDLFLSKRLVNCAVFSDNLLIICKELYYSTIWHCLRDLQLHLFCIYRRSAEYIRDFLSCGVFLD